MGQVRLDRVVGDERLDPQRRLGSLDRPRDLGRGGTWLGPHLAELGQETSAKLTELMTAPAAIASSTSEAPPSSWISASSAEASRTDAGAASGVATAARGLLLDARLRTPLGDQLVRQAPPRRHLAEQPSQALRRRAAIG
jgi:hypothetical protein